MYDPMDIDEDAGAVAPAPVMVEIPQRSRNANTKKRKHPRKRSAKISKRKLSDSRKCATMANKGDFAMIETVSSRLVVANPLVAFADQCESALSDWISILAGTSLSDITTGTDPRITNAFKELDNTIFGIASTEVRRRFAYLRLLDVFEFLENILHTDYQAGRIDFRSGYGACSVAMDIYMSAQTRLMTKKQLNERTRYARRLRDLAGQPPFFLLIYSTSVDTVAYASPLLFRVARMLMSRRDRSSGFNVPTLKLIASNIMGKSPSKLITACQKLADLAASAVESRQPCDTLNLGAGIQEYLLAEGEQPQP